MVGSKFNPRPKSINEVVDYVLKKLGVELLEVNVTHDQILDRISDAVTYFQEHHADGTFEGYFKTKIIPTKLVISPSIVSASISPSASFSASTSPSRSPSVSPSASISKSRSASPSPSSSGSPSSSLSISPSSSFSPSSSRSASPSATPSVSPSASISPSASVSPSSSRSPSISPSSSFSPSSSLSPSSSTSRSISPSASLSRSASISPSSSVSASPSPSAPYVIKIGDSIVSSTWSAKVYSINAAQTEVEIKDFLPFDPDSAIADGQALCIENEDYVIDSFLLGTAEIGYITIPNNVESIVSVAQLPSYNSKSTGSSDPFRTWTNQLFHYKGSGLGISFYLQEVRNETLSQLNTLQPWADFNRYMNRAYLNAFDYNANIGKWLVLRVITAVDPEEYPEMYGDTWFLRYCTELIRRQWGENLEKFDEVSLLNGVKVNGTKMRDLADTRIKDLEDEMFSTYRKPDDFFLA